MLDQIIASVPNKYPPFLQLLKETGIRGCEAWKLRWDFIDFDRRLVHVDPAKNGNARTLPISKKLIAMLNNLPRETEYVFKNGKLESFRGGFRTHRKELAVKLADPDILKCSFKVFRDFFASKTYAEFLSKSEVSLRLGHRSETSTEPYIIRQLLEDPKYIAGIAHNTEEEVQLTEAGFEYIKDTSDGCSLWRKRSI